jgi:hypothetical protein
MGGLLDNQSLYVHGIDDAEKGAEACKVGGKKPPPVLLTDIRMKFLSCSCLVHCFYGLVNCLLGLLQ